MDGQFEHLRGDMSDLKVTLNTVANAEHVPDVERYIRTLKERTRCVYNTLPFTRLPKRMVIEMVYASAFWLNSIPPHDGVSKAMSPRTIITGQRIDFTRQIAQKSTEALQHH